MQILLSYHRILELISVFSVALPFCRGTWLVELVEKLGLRPLLFFLGATAGVRYMICVLDEQ